MSADVRIRWGWPDTRSGGRLPLPIEEVAHIRLEARVQGAPGFSEIATVTPPTVERLLDDLASGSWEFRGIVVDSAGRESDPVTGSITIPLGDEDRPDPATEFTVELA